jgi:hypothetical protein
MSNPNQKQERAMGKENRLELGIERLEARIAPGGAGDDNGSNHSNGTHTNGTHTNGTHTNGTHTNGTHTNGTHDSNG